MKKKQQLLETLENAFARYENKRTRWLYQRLVCKLLRHHNPDGKLVVPPEKMTQAHIDEFLAWMVRPGEYSRSYCNSAKRAIKVFFAYVGNSMEVQMVSTRHRQRIPDTLTRQEIQNTLAGLCGVYRLATEDFYNLLPPGDILRKYGSGRGALRRQTLNEKISDAARNAGIYKLVTSATIRNSGMAHLLDDGVPIAEVAEKAGLTIRTVKTFWLRLNNIQEATNGR